MYNIIIVHDGNKYYTQVFLDDCLRKLPGLGWMLGFDEIDVSQDTDTNKTGECTILTSTFLV